MTNEQEKKELIDFIRNIAPPGTTIYTICRKVSRSGMSHIISLIIFTPNNEERLVPFCLDYYAAKILAWRLTPDGILVKGYGMDMGYYIVNQLCNEVYGQNIRVLDRKDMPINFDTEKENALWAQCWL